VHATRHGGSRKAASRGAHRPQKKPTSHPKRRGLDRRNHRRYRAFLRHGKGRLYARLARLVEAAPPPYRTRPYGTRGRPPTPPKDVLRFLLIKNNEGWSYDETASTLEALPELAHTLGFRGKVPAASTVLGWVDKVPVPYLEGLIARTVRSLVRGRTNAAGDATGLATRQYEQWFAVRHGKKLRRRKFVKLHSLIATRAQWPFFLSVRVTRGTRGDSPELARLLERLDPTVELGNLPLDKGYQSRRNATLIEERGGVPVMALKANATAKTLGHPAWKRMVLRQRADGRAHRLRYNRRTIQEGLYGAFKGRFGERVRARKRPHQRVEILCRVVLWNLWGQVYHLG
jgi:transposase